MAWKLTNNKKGNSLVLGQSKGNQILITKEENVWSHMVKMLYFVSVHNSWNKTLVGKLWFWLMTWVCQNNCLTPKYIWHQWAWRQNTLKQEAQVLIGSDFGEKKLALHSLDGEMQVGKLKLNWLGIKEWVGLAMLYFLYILYF